jgi:hypothetical protein
MTRVKVDMLTCGVAQIDFTFLLRSTLH